MLKEVGASGQISLGKKYAGQLFEVQIQPDGALLMRPVKVVPATALVSEAQPSSYARGGPDSDAARSNRDWAETHAPQIEQYNNWAANREPYSQRVRRWREQGV